MRHRTTHVLALVVLCALSMGSGWGNPGCGSEQRTKPKPYPARTDGRWEIALDPVMRVEVFSHDARGWVSQQDVSSDVPIELQLDDTSATVDCTLPQVLCPHEVLVIDDGGTIELSRVDGFHLEMQARSQPWECLSNEPDLPDGVCGGHLLPVAQDAALLDVTSDGRVIASTPDRDYGDESARQRLCFARSQVVGEFGEAMEEARSLQGRILVSLPFECLGTTREVPLSAESRGRVTLTLAFQASRAD